MKKRWIFATFSGRACLALLLAMALSLPAIAQYSYQYGDPSTRVARLNLIQGDVSLQPAGENEWVWASQNRPLTTYDGIWTGPGSRAELHIGSTAIRVAPRTAFSFLNLDDDAVQIELTSGTMNVRVRNMDRNEIYEVDTPNIAFSLLSRGEYRITVDPDDDFTTVTVRSGEGQITGGGQALLVNAGTQVQVSGRDYITYDAYYVSDRDWFDRWTYARDVRESRSLSTRHVSPELTGYEDLDRYGTWRNDPNYGAVWVPTRATRGDWAPYRNGHWAWVEPWGWTWVDDAPFGFVTSHYGRWTSLNTGYGQSVWAWVPPRRERTERPAYAPALVTFVSTSREPSYANNVVWVPLAPGEVYVPSYRASTTYVTRVNLSNTAVPQQRITAAVSNPQQAAPSVNQKVAGAVVAVPKTAFVNAQSVATTAVKVDTQAVAAAPAAAAPPVAPVKTSVVQASAPAAKAAAPAPKPPAEVETKEVVAKVAPPPPPVPFEKKQQALAANAGKPLDAKQEQNLRAAAPAPPKAVVTAPPPKEVKPAAELAKKPQPAVSPNEKKLEHPTPPGRQRAEEARQQAAQQQAEKERAQQLAAQERAAKEKAQQEAALAKQQAEQQRIEKERAQQLAAQQQAEKERAQQQAAQQQAEKQRAQQQAAQAQQQAERARQQAAQQQAEKERAQQQAAQQQAEKERAQQQAAQAQQQAERARQQERERQQMAQNRPPTPPEKGRAPEKAPAAQAAGEPLRVPENVQAAKLVSQPELKPPASGARGIVRVHAVIGTDGRVKSAEALTGGPQMRAAALENVRGRVYQPTLVNGKPVEVETEITIRF